MLPQGLGVALSRKAILFRGLRDATSKTKHNKSWDQINATTGSAWHHVRLYLCARHTLITAWSATEVARCPFTATPREAIEDHSSLGLTSNLQESQNTTLPWFWAVDLQVISEMVESLILVRSSAKFTRSTSPSVYRVHRLIKKSPPCDRWQDETTLACERKWTGPPNFTSTCPNSGSWGQKI